MRNTLISGLEKLSIAYNEKQLDQIDAFYEMIIEKNKVMNLTRITDREEFASKHVLDSLLIAEIFDKSLNENKYILDVGTGAGFPGIPIKIFFPDTRIVLLDSLNKRLLFLNDVIRELGLKDIHTAHGRAEELGHNKEYREKFDIVVSRAVANLSVLSELCLPFVKVEGYFISYKSSDADDEISAAENAINILSGGNIDDIVVNNIELPDTDIIRKLVQIKKEKTTPKMYPRKAGTPSKNPL